jgi:hypothetical protein
VPIPRIINLNDTTPGPPVGRSNVRWQGDDQDPRNVSAYVLLGGVNAQTGTSYAFVEDDEGRLVAFSNAAAVAVGLASAVALPNGFWTVAANYGAGTVTITPDVSTINGVASLDLTQNQWAIIFSDGVNYFAAVMGGGSITRTTTTLDAGTLAGGASATGSILLCKLGGLLKVVASARSRLRLYKTSAGRDADASRAYGTAPVHGCGLLVEIAWELGTSTPLTYPMFGTPGLGNDDTPQTATIYWAVTNNELGSTHITFDLTYEILMA